MEISLDIGNDCIVELEGKFIAGDPGVHTFRNGDPGYPPTPAEFEIESIQCGKPAELIDCVEEFYMAELERIKKQVLKIASEEIHDSGILARITRSFYLNETFSENLSWRAAEEIEKNESGKIDDFPDTDVDFPEDNVEY